MKLNIGCGETHYEGFVNVDKAAQLKPDLCFDIELAWPIEDGSVDEIRAYHILEHISNFCAVTKNIYRALKVGGFVDVVVPHPRSDGFLGDPTHVRPIMPATLELCGRKANDKWRKMGAANSRLAYIWGVDMRLAAVDFILTDEWRKKSATPAEIDFAMRSYNNVCEQMRMKWIKDSEWAE